MTRDGTGASQDILTVTCLNNESENFQAEWKFLGSVSIFLFSTQEYPVTSLDHFSGVEVVNHSFLVCEVDIDACNLAIIFL